MGERIQRNGQTISGIKNKEKMTEIIADKNKQDIWIKRNFNASKDMVFRLFTEEALQFQWQNALLKNFKFVTFNCKDGGNFHSTHLGLDGNIYGFIGVYHEIIENEKIIRTSEFLGLPFKVLPTLEIISFGQSGDTTTLIIQIICDSETTRDAMVAHGMKSHFDAIFGAMDVILV
jgi:uncharacterized protein YndB with AHSA1/START domain